MGRLLKILSWVIPFWLLACGILFWRLQAQFEFSTINGQLLVFMAVVSWLLGLVILSAQLFEWLQDYFRYRR